MGAFGVSTLPNALDLVKPGGTYVSIPTLVDDGDMTASAEACAAKGVTRCVYSTRVQPGWEGKSDGFPPPFNSSRFGAQHPAGAGLRCYTVFKGWDTVH